MATVDDLFPSKYLKAADLNGKPQTLEIIEAPVETLKTLDGREGTKVVLYFRNFKKVLPLNKTNFNLVRRITGKNDSDDFPGHKICVYPDVTAMGGDIVDCIRIRAPAKAPGTAKAVTIANGDPPDDGVPFNDDIADTLDEEVRS